MVIKLLKILGKDFWKGPGQVIVGLLTIVAIFMVAVFVIGLGTGPIFTAIGAFEDVEVPFYQLRGWDFISTSISSGAITGIGAMFLCFIVYALFKAGKYFIVDFPDTFSNYINSIKRRLKENGR